ncbi:MAG: hypothetical protein ABIZ80_24120 [Bryobacteraceae bacterium]
MWQALQPHLSIAGGPFACEPAVLTRAGTRRGVLSLFIPDLSVLALLITLLYCLFLFEGYQKLFRDSDTGWHIRTGETILATGALPHSDPYSFTRLGQPWFAWEWGADVLMGGVHRLAGTAGVAMLYALVIASCTWLWFQLTWASGGNFLLAAALAGPMLSTSNIHWLARPHVLSWVFLLVAVIVAERASRRDLGLWWLAALPFTALWTNIHASFFFAPLIALVYAAGTVARAQIWGITVAGRARWFLLAAVAAAAGSLINPYGWQLHQHLFVYLTNADLMARIGEFQSFNFHAEGAFQILLTVAVGMLGGVLALGQGKVAQFLLSVILVGAALRSARGLPLVALIVLPLACGAITEGLAKARGLRPAVRRSLDRFLAYSERLR